MKTTLQSSQYENFGHTDTAKAQTPQRKSIATTVSVVTIDPAAAKKYLALNFERNRPIRSSHIKFLVNEMLNDRFIPEIVNIGIAVLSGRGVLINGQHTLNALIESGKTYKLQISRFECRCEDDIATLYSKYDINRTRTIDDTVRAFSIADNTGLTGFDIRNLNSAIQFGIRHFGGINLHKFPDEYSLQWIESFSDTYKYVHEDILKTGFESWQRARTRGFLSVILPMYVYDRDSASDFWVSCFGMNTNGINDPRARLLSAIMRDVGKYSKKKYTTYQISRLIARAWNLHIESKECKRLLPMENVKIIIKNTPFNGKQADYFYPNVNLDSLHVGGGY